MGPALAHLPTISDQHRFNQLRWEELLQDRFLNTRPELEEKKRLYFEAGASEVWICGETGAISFFLAAQPDIEAPASQLCPGFPAQVPSS